MTGTWLFGTEPWFMVSSLHYLAYVSWKHFKLQAEQGYAKAEEGYPSSVSKYYFVQRKKLRRGSPAKWVIAVQWFLCTLTNFLCIILGALFHHWLWDCRNEVIWKIYCNKPNTCSKYFSGSPVEVHNTVSLTWITLACRSSLKPGLHLAEFSKWTRVLCWGNRYMQFRSHLTRDRLSQHIINVLCPLATLKSVLLRNQYVKENGFFFIMLLNAKAVSKVQEHTIADLLLFLHVLSLAGFFQCSVLLERMWHSVRNEYWYSKINQRLAKGSLSGGNCKILSWRCQHLRGSVPYFSW